MATQEQKSATDLGAQAIALAEQLGRIAGTIEGTAESWLQRQKLADQLTRVRDGATQMLEGLKPGAGKGRSLVGRVKPGKNGAKNAAPQPAQPRMAHADPAHAPGKKRRKPAPTLKGVKKSDEKIPKLRTAAAARQRRKSYA